MPPTVSAIVRHYDARPYHRAEHRQSLSTRLRYDQVDNAAATVERLVVGTSKGEVGLAVDVLINRTAGQRGDRGTDRWRDHLIAALNRRIVSPTAVQIGCRTDVGC